MDAAIKKLLQKEKPDAREVCRILLANLIDIQNDRKGMSIADSNRINQLFFESPESDQYGHSLEIYRTVQECMDLGNNLLRQAYLACSGFKLFCENIYFANKDYPACNWKRYQIGIISRETREQGKWLWANLRTTLRSSGSVKGVLKIIGRFFEVPKLEKLLIDDRPLKKGVEDLDGYMKQALSEFNQKNMPTILLKEAKDIFTPLIFKNSQPNKTELEETAELLDTCFFYNSVQNMIEALNPYYPEKMPGEK